MIKNLIRGIGLWFKFVLYTSFIWIPFLLYGWTWGVGVERTYFGLYVVIITYLVFLGFFVFAKLLQSVFDQSAMIEDIKKHFKETD